MPAGTAAANTSHEGWPRIDGMLLMNKTDAARPLDARPGHDPFAGTDPRYSCDAIHKRGSCQRRMVRTAAGVVVTSRARATTSCSAATATTPCTRGRGATSCGPTTSPRASRRPRSTRSSAATARDFIYASHGTNTIAAGGGDDWIKAHFGRGTIDCGGGRDLLYISRRAQRHYAIRHCERISHKTLGR